VPALPGAKTMPCAAMVMSPSSRRLFWKYLPIFVAKGVVGSCP
jgi:hypothetical protein